MTRQRTPAEQRAQWTQAEIDRLPDSSFAVIEPGGTRDREGRTVPRSKRHLPFKDANGAIDLPHLRNALARLPQADLPAALREKAARVLDAAAKEAKIGDYAEDSARSAAAVTRVTLPGTVRVLDAERREIEVCATSEARDTFGTIFSYEASKDAFERWIGNLREMHAPVAIGRRINIRCDDAERRIYVHGRISRGAEPTWQKVLDGTLRGASIGASNVEWERRTVEGHEVPVAIRYDLVELSLVDNPSNPDADGLVIVRAAAADPDDLFADPETEASTANVDSTAREAEAPSVPEQPEAAASEAPSEPLGAEPSADLVAAAPEDRAQTAEPPADAAATIPYFDPLYVIAERVPNSPLAQRLLRERREATVRAAGDAAVADLHWQPGEDYTAYLARVQQVRGLAETRALQALLAPPPPAAAPTQEDSAVPTPETQRAIPASHSGSDLSAPKAESPVMTVQPSNVGQRDLVNTEDAAAKDFGVPEEAEERPTPEEHVLSPDQFHEGGHAQEATWTDGTLDADGDHDGAEDAAEQANGPRTLSRPPAASAIPEGRPTPGAGRADQPTDTRASKRLSDKSVAQLHGIRDHDLSGLNQALALCGCDDCQEMAGVLSMLAEDEAGEDDAGDEPKAAARGQEARQQRIMLALVRRSVAQVTSPILEQWNAVLQDGLASLSEQLSQMLAETQRGTVAQVSRGVASEITDRLTQVTQDIAQRAEAAASLGEGLRERVERLEAAPDLSGGPVAHLADKRLMMQRAADASPSPEEQLAALQQQRATSPGEQMALAAQILQLQEATRGHPLGPSPVFGSDRRTPGR